MTNSEFVLQIMEQISSYGMEKVIEKLPPEEVTLDFKKKIIDFNFNTYSYGKLKIDSQELLDYFIEVMVKKNDTTNHRENIRRWESSGLVISEENKGRLLGLNYGAFRAFQTVSPELTEEWYYKCREMSIKTYMYKGEVTINVDGTTFTHSDYNLGVGKVSNHYYPSSVDLVRLTKIQVSKRKYVKRDIEELIQKLQTKYLKFVRPCKSKLKLAEQIKYLESYFELCTDETNKASESDEQVF